MLKILPLLLTLSSFALAQTTWRGLRFGMTEEEAQKVYEGDLRKMSEEEVRAVYSERFKEEAKNQDMLEDNAQKIGTMHARARLVFDKKTIASLAASGSPPVVTASTTSINALSQINVAFEDPFVDQVGHDDVLAHSVAAINLLDRSLAEKYSKPTTDKRDCDLTVRAAMNTSALSCDKMWKSEGQSIRMVSFFQIGRLRLVTLTYKPIPKDI